ncbi:MAG: L,D-transpeptidase family protein [Sulfitobacter sp.]
MAAKMTRFDPRTYFAAGVFALFSLVWTGVSTPVQAQVTAFKQAVAEAASRDEDIAAFYRGNGYDPIWTGSGKDKQRRAALLNTVSKAADHGLPASRYDVDALRAQMSAAKTPRDLGLLEVEMSRMFLQYARDVQTGILVPKSINSSMVRDVPYRDRTSYLVNFSKSSPSGFFKSLPPATIEYNALMKARLDLERLQARGGWGRTVPAKSLKPGSSGDAVVALRDRLIAMGYLKRSASKTYDPKMQAAVQRFQTTHGMDADGVAGASTVVEINKSVQSRLQSIIVAMERERWLNQDRGRRHVLVNLADFTAKIVDDGKVTFTSKSVIGANRAGRHTPEFSDVMEHMVINPSWYVPRSIVTKEYLPQLQRNPNAVGHIEITDSRGRKVNRGAVNFAQYSARTFPFAMRQPPSSRNALGLVKFMFPNKYNIYLHDTPAKNLFGREVRAFSHGCIRLADPFGFAYALLAKQTSDPKGLFHSQLSTGRETKQVLDAPVPVHIIYRTAITSPKGEMEYRRDIYGRDAQIWNALSQAGVALPSVQG